MTGATIKDVARRAGVHPGTASRALNPQTRSRVRNATARKVIAAAEALGYQANPLARSLRTNRSLSVGMLIPDLTNPIFPPMVRGVDAVLGEVDYTVLVANTDDDPDREALLFNVLRSRQVDGFIVGTARREDPLLVRADADGVPLVLINRLTEGLVVPSVSGDDATGVRQAIAHLAELGHTRIAHLAGPQSTSPGLLRLRAYRQALADHGLPADPDLVVCCSAFTEEEGARGLRELLKNGVDFTAVLAGNDLLALGCYDVMAEQGLTCPDDFSLIGFNDMPFLDKLRPPLTTVHASLYDMGAEAAHLLLDRLADRQRAARAILLPVRLVVRGSTSPPRGARR